MASTMIVMVQSMAVESFDDLQTFEDTWNPIRGTLTEQLIGFESVPVGFALTTEYADWDGRWMRPSLHPQM